MWKQRQQVVPGHCGHLAAWGPGPYLKGMAQAHYDRSSKELARGEKQPQSPGILGKKRQMYLAQGPGIRGPGAWVL